MRPRLLLFFHDSLPLECADVIYVWSLASEFSSHLLLVLLRPLSRRSGLKVVDGGLGPWGAGAQSSAEGSCILRKVALCWFLGR